MLQGSAITLAEPEEDYGGCYSVALLRIVAPGAGFRGVTLYHVTLPQL